MGTKYKLTNKKFILQISNDQTWNLSKNLHRRIFRLKILHRQFYLISTVLVRKKTQKMSENGEIYTAGKNFTLPPAVTAWTNSTSAVGQHYHYWFLNILPSFHGAQEHYLCYLMTC